ncbi:MAG: ABC transporter ATP-binding protein, partial [Clostridia bacterium]|nr:ABC transporter ATP-binding protein [Clostridia bacterium]
IREHGLTALMVTHNMKDALALGNRTIMMHEGRIIMDLDLEAKQKLTVEDLLARFGQISGKELANDRMLLA